MYSSLKDNDEINLKIGKLKDIEKQVIQKVMEREKGNQSNTAKIIGINRSTLRRKFNDCKSNIDERLVLLFCFIHSLYSDNINYTVANNNLVEYNIFCKRFIFI